MAAGGGGVRVGVVRSGSIVAVWVALSPVRFLLDFERASAWGLDPDRDLILRLEFSCAYTGADADPPRVTNVLQAPPDVPLHQSDLDQVATPCSLELTVVERVKEWVCGKPGESVAGQWPPQLTGSLDRLAHAKRDEDVAHWFASSQF